ncbi:MAG: 3-oxo-tetronate 4-phosphate decarboxylase [Pseudomonadota bacterium]
MRESALREEMAVLSKSLFDRGLTSGSTGNISVATDDGWLMSPTGSSMGSLDPAAISKIDKAGTHIAGHAPTKEAFLHQAMFAARPKAGAIVHLHSTYSVAVSCLEGLNPKEVLPPLTPYFVMRIGKLGLVPYFPPGDVNLAKAVQECAMRHSAILLANHGPVVAGKSLKDAVYASEELEETAKLFLVLQGLKTVPLKPEQVSEIERRFPKEV